MTAETSTMLDFLRQRLAADDRLDTAELHAKMWIIRAWPDPMGAWSAEEADAAMWSCCATALQHDVTRQITRFGAEAVARPRSGTGVAQERKPGVHEEVPLGMLAELRRHAADHADLGRDGCHVRKQLAHRHATLAVAMERPVRGLHGAVVVELRLLHLAGHRLAVPLLQLRLVSRKYVVKYGSHHHRHCCCCLFGLLPGRKLLFRHWLPEKSS